MIFRDIQGYRYIFSYTHRRAIREEPLSSASPALFENQNKCPDFGKKDPDCAYLWVKFSIQNVVLRVSWKKNSKMFPYEVPFSCIVDKMFIEVAYFHNSPSPTLKKFWLRICIQTLLYWQNAPS